MRRLLIATAAAVALFGGAAIADLSVKDGAGTTRTIYNYVCFTTKLCNATVLINSAGTEIAPLTDTQLRATALPLPTGAATSANQSTANTSLATIATATTGVATAANQATANTSLATIASAVSTPIPAGTNAIGKVEQSVNVTPTNCSGTVTAGGTAQNAFTAQTGLHGFTIANLDTSEPLWISFTGTAAATATASYPLAAATATTFAGLSSYTSPPGFGINTALSVVAATTGHKWSCTWW